MKLQTTGGRIIVIAAAGAVFLADVITKSWILQTFELHQSKVMTSFLNLGLWLNTGAAFSFLSDAGGWQRYFFSVIAAIAIVWLSISILFNQKNSGFIRTAFALIAGGAGGNLYDRLLHGAVVDWIDIHYSGLHWPAFNFADCAIISGAILFAASPLVDRYYSVK